LSQKSILNDRGRQHLQKVRWKANFSKQKMTLKPTPGQPFWGDRDKLNASYFHFQLHNFGLHNWIPLPITSCPKWQLLRLESHFYNFFQPHTFNTADPLRTFPKLKCSQLSHTSQNPRNLSEIQTWLLGNPLGSDFPLISLVHELNCFESHLPHPLVMKLFKLINAQIGPLGLPKLRPTYVFRCPVQLTLHTSHQHLPQTIAGRMIDELPVHKVFRVFYFNHTRFVICGLPKLGTLLNSARKGIDSNFTPHVHESLSSLAPHPGPLNMGSPLYHPTDGPQQKKTKLSCTDPHHDACQWPTLYGASATEKSSKNCSTKKCKFCCLTTLPHVTCPTHKPPKEQQLQVMKDHRLRHLSCPGYFLPHKFCACSTFSCYVPKNDLGHVILRNTDVLNCSLFSSTAKKVLCSSMCTLFPMSPKKMEAFFADSVDKFAQGLPWKCGVRQAGFSCLYDFCLRHPFPQPLSDDVTWKELNQTREELAALNLWLVFPSDKEPLESWLVCPFFWLCRHSTTFSTSHFEVFPLTAPSPELLDRKLLKIIKSDRPTTKKIFQQQPDLLYQVTKIGLPPSKTRAPQRAPSSYLILKGKSVIQEFDSLLKTRHITSHFGHPYSRVMSIASRCLNLTVNLLSSTTHYPCTANCHFEAPNLLDHLSVIHWINGDPRGAHCSARFDVHPPNPFNQDSILGKPEPHKWNCTWRVWESDVKNMFDEINPMDGLTSLAWGLDVLKTRESKRSLRSPFFSLSNSDKQLDKLGKGTTRDWFSISFQDLFQLVKEDFSQNNYSRVGTVIFRQVVGLPQGGKCSDPIARLFCIFKEFHRSRKVWPPHLISSRYRDNYLNFEALFPDQQPIDIESFLKRASQVYDLELKLEGIGSHERPLCTLETNIHPNIHNGLSATWSQKPIEKRPWPKHTKEPKFLFFHRSILINMVKKCLTFSTTNACAILNLKSLMTDLHHANLLLPCKRKLLASISRFFSVQVAMDARGFIRDLKTHVAGDYPLKSATL